MPFFKNRKKTKKGMPSVIAGASMDQKMPNSELLYLMRMSDVMRLVSNSRRLVRFLNRVHRLGRALKTRTGASSIERRGAPADAALSTRPLGESPNAQSPRR